MLQINKFLIKFFCQKVGVDQFGNCYYLGKSKNYLGNNKRYVLYNGINESSKVPPMWHSWLHYLGNEVPNNEVCENHKWQKEHLPNLSGTKNAYDPSKSKHISREVYSSWKPE